MMGDGAARRGGWKDNLQATSGTNNEDRLGRRHGLFEVVCCC
jgi:hypothetical protein